MKKTIILTMTALAAGCLCLQAHAQEFELKPHVGIGLGNAVSIESTLPLDTRKSSTMEYGLDFGWNFWKKGGNSLSANIGIGYRDISFTLDGFSGSYVYSAPPAADMDGDTYLRYYDITGLGEKLYVGYVDIPVYIGYEYRVADRFGVYADLGVSLGFKSGSRVKSVEGTAKVWGVYPQYGDDFVMDEPYLNGFGEVSLGESRRGSLDAGGFMGSLLVGGGVKARIAGPLWINAGVRYDHGFSDIFKKGMKGSDFTAETAPVTYTVAGGEEVRALSSYLNKSGLSTVSLNVGLTIEL